MKTTDSNKIGIKYLLENSLTEILSLREKVEQLQSKLDEPIAIVGIGCRFPGGSDSPEAFWRMIESGTCAVRDVTDERWSAEDYHHADTDLAGKIYSKHAGLLKHIDTFDAELFNLPAHEANLMDPQQRLLLMVSWEALRNANLNPAQLRGSSTGVFFGMSTHDYGRLAMDPLAPEAIDAYACLGNAQSIAAGRVSYLFGFHGPTMTLDTSCSSSLLSVHLACTSLRSGESSLALAGGVNLILAPENSIGLSRMQALSRTGLCRTFDADADGYVRGEGCGVVVLKKLSQAQKDNDHIYAVIRGSAVNHDGASNGLTAPNGRMQQEVIERALKEAKVNPAQIQYIETHGTGTPLGDPIEVKALVRALRHGQESRPLVIGSVKTNIGHLESAAGIAALIKLALSLEQKCIPPHLHLSKPNPHIPWDRYRILVPQERQAWPAEDSVSFAGVSAFGLSGTNVHMVLSSAAANAESDDASSSLEVLTFGASTETGLLRTAEKWSSFLERSSLPYGQICSASNVYRHAGKHRLALLTDSPQEARRLLAQLAAGELPSQAYQGNTRSGRANLAMLFTGQGAQYAGMGQGLYGRMPAFRDAMDRCDALYSNEVGHSLKDVLWGEKSTELGETQYTQPATFCLQYALAQLWQALGLKPSFLIGHSVGEYAAACLAGVFSLEDGLKLIIKRGQLMIALTQPGDMLAIQAQRQEVGALIAEHAGQVSIAAQNSSNSLVISGERATIALVKAQLDQKGISNTRLQVSHAFHSPLMQPMLEAFRHQAQAIELRPPSLPFYSTVLGRRVDNELCDAEYWVNQIAAPVEFYTALQALLQEKVGAFLEIGPSATLVDITRRALSADEEQVVLYSLRKNFDDYAVLRSTLAQLYVQGVMEKLPVNGPARKFPLPVEALNEKTYWLNGGQRPELISRKSRSNVLGKKTVSAIGNLIYETRFAADAPFPIGDHRLYNTVVIAGASHLAMTALIAEDLRLQPGYEISDVIFPGAMVFAPDETKSFQYLVSERDDALEVTGFSRTEGSDGKWQKNFACALASREQAPLLAESEQSVELTSLFHGLDEQVDGMRFYQEMASAGYDLNGCFRWVEHIWRRQGEALSRLRAPRPEDSGYMIPPGLMDAFFQTAAAASLDERFGLAGREEIFIPFAVDAMRVLMQARGPLWCHVQCLSYAAIGQGSSSPEAYSHRVSVYNESGAPVVRVEALRSKRAPKSVLIDSLQRKQSLTYQINWVAAAAKPLEDGAPSTAGLWIILGDQGAYGTQLHQRLKQAGLRSLHLSGAAQADDRQDSRYYDQDQPDSLVSIIHGLSEGQPIHGVINLQALEQTVDLAAQDLKSQQRRLLQPTLLLQQYCLSKGDEPDWTFVSPFDDQPASAAPLPAMLRGLARVMSEEYPQARIKHLELPRGEVAANIERVFTELSLADDETDIRYLKGQRNVARLAELPCELASAKDIRFASDRTYLITGGLGAIGLGLAELIIERGGRHLVLLARRPQAQHADAHLSRWAALGADVRVMTCDVSQPTDLHAVLGEIDRDMPRLDGLFHCAGILRDGLIATQSWEDFAAPFAAKADGAWWLHQATRARELSWFVLFSSAASVLGSPGQANYAAANAFLDQLASYRRAQGLPGLSINWGPWDGEGMANTTAHIANFQRAAGVGLLEPQRAYEVLLALAAAQQTNPTVMNIDWNTLHASVSERAQRTLLANLIVKKDRSSGQNEVNLHKLRQECDPLTPAERVTHIETFVLRLVRDIMAFNESHVLSITEPLQTEGLDSLMALELRNKLTKVIGRKLPATLLFDYPTVRAMSSYVVEQLYPQENPHESAAAQRSQYLSQALDLPAEEENFSSLSDDELAALLADEAI